MNTYTVELPDGKVQTRNSKRIFTHAVIVRDVFDGVAQNWGTAAFAGSFELAAKTLAQTESRYNAPRNKNYFAGTEFRIVEVKVA